jgi:hypothetical protein
VAFQGVSPWLGRSGGQLYPLGDQAALKLGAGAPNGKNDLSSLVCNNFAHGDTTTARDGKQQEELTRECDR